MVGLERHHRDLHPFDGVVISGAGLRAEIGDRHPQSARVVILLDFDGRLALENRAFVRRLLGIDDERDARIMLEALELERARISVKRDLAGLVFVLGRDGVRRAIGRGDREHRDMGLR